MIIGDDFFDDEILNDNTSCLIDVTKLQFTNMMLDKLTMLNEAEEINSCEMPAWDSNTVLSGDFQGNVELGSLGTKGETVDKVLIKRRRNNGAWMTIDEFDYDPVNNGTIEYKAKDKFVEALENYSYAVVPSSNGNEGMYNVKEITPEFEEAYLFDADEYYWLIYDFKYGSLTRESANTTIQTLGGRYPVVVYNGNIDYNSGSVSCKILAVVDNEYDKISTKDLRNKLMNFLINKKPKVLKSEDGLFMLIDIVGSPNISFNRGANNVYDLSFNFVEIADGTDNEVLEEYELSKVERLSEITV